MDMDGWVGADAAADLLGISRKSVYDYALRLDGFPQPTKIGRTVLWQASELAAWREKHPARRRAD